MRALIPLLLTAACSLSPGPLQGAACRSDDECGEGKLCFASGCASPDLDLVAEVSGGPSGGPLVQDFVLPQVTASLDFDLAPMVGLVGEFQREKSAGIDPTNRAIYREPVTLRVEGESAVVPGLKRSFTATFSQTERGFFSLPTGTGRYSAEAVPEDRSVPPEHAVDIKIERHVERPSVTLAFGSVEGVVRLQGRVLRKARATSLEPDQPVVEAPIDLQVFDPTSGLPLSQRVEVSSGTNTSTGDFAVTLSPKARDLSVVSLVVSPRRPSAMVPTKAFPVNAPFASGLVLELGEFGRVVPVRGTVVDASGQPVAQAQVVFEGEIEGGRFRSQVVFTDSVGRFGLDFVPTPPGVANFAVTIVPPPESGVGIWRGPVRVLQGLNANEPGELKPSTLTCPKRIEVRGTLLTPDRQPASRVAVRATSLEADNARSLPVDDVEALTDESGAFVLALDPGAWRLDFIPPVGGSNKFSQRMPAYPRLSRTLRLNSLGPSGTAEASFEAGAFVLQQGRLVQGVITTQGRSVPNGQVRFFRVGNAREAGPTPQLLGAATADGEGRYQAVLPTAK
jgi:hypothetical protein